MKRHVFSITHSVMCFRANINWAWCVRARLRSNTQMCCAPRLEQGVGTDIYIFNRLILIGIDLCAILRYGWHGRNNLHGECHEFHFLALLSSVSHLTQNVRARVCVRYGGIGRWPKSSHSISNK